MKTFKIALWAVVATLWALPVAAQSLVLTTPTGFIHQIGFDVNPANGQLRGADLASIWTVSDSSEFDLFQAGEFRVDFGMTNAGLDFTTGDITLAVLDDSGEPITSSTFAYAIDDSVFPHRLEFDPDDLTEATDFVHSFSTNPSAIQVILTADVRATMFDTDQEARIQSCGRLNETLVACDDARLPVFL